MKLPFMKQCSKMFGDFKNFVYNGYGDEPAKMLVHTGTLGWILSSLAQIGAVVFNEKIPKEQKAFLIPQEIGDAAVNILSFYLITNSLKNFSAKLVSSGKLVTPKIKQFLVNLKAQNVIKKTSGYDLDIEKIPSFINIKEDYDSFKNGVTVVASTLGSIFSCNLLTPVVRNAFASDRQQASIAKMNARVPKSIVKAPKGLSMDQYKTMARGGSLRV